MNSKYNIFYFKFKINICNVVNPCFKNLPESFYFFTLVEGMHNIFFNVTVFINLFIWGFTSLSTLYRSYYDG